MKILHVIPSLEMGGAERLTVNLAAAQIALGHEVAICCVMMPPERGRLYNTAQKLGIKCYYSYSKHEPRIMPTIRFARLIKKLSPDVVQSYLPRANSCTAVAAKLAGIRCIIATFHDSIIWANKHQRKWGRWTARLQDGIFCDAQCIKKCLIEDCPRAAHKTRVVYPGIPDKTLIFTEEEKRAFRQKWGISEEDRLVGIVARLAQVKDHFTFIGAAEILLRNAPRIKFLISGEGPLKDQLKRHIVEKGLERSVLMLGFVPSIEIVLSILDIFVLTSLSEGFPISILEAFAAGLPVVATNVGGIPEVVQPGENGFLVEPRQPARLARKIQTILDDSVLMAKMRKNTRKTTGHFRIEKTAQRTIDCYEEISR